jgi:hypothetical protein
MLLFCFQTVQFIIVSTLLVLLSDRYISFHDIMAMLLLGFVQWLVRLLYSDIEMPLSVSVVTLIDAEFATATLMITFGDIFGRASPLQIIIICCSQSLSYASHNKIILVLGFIHAEDMGRSMTVYSK